ncbi:hypothetical protein GCM10023116_28230 [Kistimonas scapharcae]|uniref:PPM-type phosphatase domain-containing protein n=2 Tax=Kistimonas scapharcae TaxID=1036133 RepID=A0ABP8V646_9GAMM
MLPYELEQQLIIWHELDLPDPSDAVRTYNPLKLSFTAVDRMASEKDGGTTAVVAMVIGSTLFVCNVGDSRAILITATGRVFQASEDARCGFDETQSSETSQSPDKYTQSALKRGGFVFPGGVFGNRVNGEVEPARTIGDHNFGGSRFTYALNPRPKIVPFTDAILDEMLNERQYERLAGDASLKDCLLVLVSDGITGKISSQQMGDLVFVLWQNGFNPEEIAAYLIEAALQCGSKDNMSASVTPVSALYPD